MCLLQPQPRKEDIGHVKSVPLTPEDRKLHGQRISSEESPTLDDKVSISSTFFEHLFCTNVLRATFLYLQFVFLFFWSKKIVKKVACKMLVKLITVLFPTPDFPTTPTAEETLRQQPRHFAHGQEGMLLLCH